jgi:hypothetical protein
MEVRGGEDQERINALSKMDKELNLISKNRNMKLVEI